MCYWQHSGRLIRSWWGICSAIMLFFVVLSGGGASGAELTRDQIRAKLAELSQRTVKSASGHFVVVGTNRVESFSLGGWCEDAVKRIEQITGLPTNFGNRWIVIRIFEPGPKSGALATVNYGQSTSSAVAEVCISGYDDAYRISGRQAICRAIISVYTKYPAKEMLVVPVWLWVGIEQNLLFDVRSRSMEHALTLWRSGRLMTPRQIITKESKKNPDTRDIDSMAAYSAFVRFLAATPKRSKIFKSLFQNQGQDIETLLKNHLTDKKRGETLDEAWERWLLSQTRVIRGSLTISTRLIEQLQSEIRVYPGTCGVALDSAIPTDGASFDELLRLRKAEWISTFINKKTGRLSMLTAGHTSELTHITDLYNQYLSGLESDTSSVLLLRRLDAADRALQNLALRVEKAGGILNEKTLPEKNN